MKKSHLNDEFLVLVGPIISRVFACSNEEKNKPKQQRVHALVYGWYPQNVLRSSHKGVLYPNKVYLKHLFNLSIRYPVRNIDHKKLVGNFVNTDPGSFHH